MLKTPPAARVGGEQMWFHPGTGLLLPCAWPADLAQWQKDEAVSSPPQKEGQALEPQQAKA